MKPGRRIPVAFACGVIFTAIVCLGGPRPLHAADCNTNGIDDVIDIDEGISADCNANGVPDECDVAAFDLTFRPQQTIPLDGSPLAIATADVDSDGHLDLLTANSESRDLAVLLGLGDGTFQLHGRFALEDRPSEIAVGDLNGDGAPDLVVASGFSEELAVFLGTGDGDFVAGVRLDATDEPRWPLVLDLDGDGAPDVLAEANGEIVVFFGRGDGSFEPSAEYAMSRGAAVLAIADINGDGLPDMIAANSGTPTTFGLTTRLGLGGRDFAEPTFFEVGLQPTSLTSGDFNGDGADDIAVVNGNVDDVLILFGSESGALVRSYNYPVGAGPRAVDAVDMNGDGLLDIVLSRSSSGIVDLFPRSGRLRVLLGRPGGDFEPPQSFIPGDFVLRLTTGDFDGDGRGDVAASGGSGDEVSVALNETVPPVSADCNFNAIPDDCDIASGLDPDLDGDGIPDSCQTGVREFRDCNGNHVADAGELSLGVSGDCNRNGIPDPCDLLPSDFEFSAPLRVEATVSAETASLADLDADGDLDMVFVGSFAAVFVLKNDGDGKTWSRSSFGGGSWLQGIDAADLDGDRYPDLAVADRNDDVVRVHWNDGSGEFSAGPVIPVGDFPNAVAVADLDGDGRVDIAAANRETGDVSVIWNQGDREFAAGTASPVGNSPVAIATADMNGDGLLDVVTGNRLSFDVAVLLNRGNRDFRIARRFEAEGSPRGLAIGDLDGDGDQDVVAPSGDWESISILRNVGDARFTRAEVIRVPEDPRSATLNDFDGDGDLDIVTSNSSFRVSYLVNDCGEFGPTFNYFVEEQSAIFVDSGDLNGDGVPDVMVLQSRDLSLLFNDRIPAASEDLDGDGILDDCGGAQVPGDASQDGRVSAQDALVLLDHLFVSGAPLPCGDGSRFHSSNRTLLDWQFDEHVTIADPVGILRFVFLGGPPHPFAAQAADAGDCIRLADCPDAPGCP